MSTKRPYASPAILTTEQYQRLVDIRDALFQWEWKNKPDDPEGDLNERLQELSTLVVDCYCAQRRLTRDDLEAMRAARAFDDVDESHYETDPGFIPLGAWHVGGEDDPSRSGKDPRVQSFVRGLDEVQQRQYTGSVEGARLT